jgi:hypothetical protein
MVRRGSDEVLDFCTHETAASRAAETSSFRPGIPRARSRFEALADLALGLPLKGGDLLGVLLASTFPVGANGSQVLRPLWAEEAMHRAYGFVRLVDAGDIRRASMRVSPTIAGPQGVTAGDLAAQFRGLEVGGERDARPCAAVLRDVVTGLGALFGHPAGVILQCEIEEISLPAYKRRALVLAATELAGNSLLHAFQGLETGLIEVSLTGRTAVSASLRVADNGNGFTGMPPNLDRGVASSLAGLLEADLTYDRKAGWTIAEIVFPLSGS